MKKPFVRRNCVRVISGGFVMVGLLAPILADRVLADGTDSAPLLQLASGLPGMQVRLSWPGQTGVRDAIEKSTTLAGGGAGGWAQVALVEANGPDAFWLDPVRTTEKAFYRIVQPQPDVFSISPPLVSTTGGTLLIQGQLIPPGSSLVLSIAGQADVIVALVEDPAHPGTWIATLLGASLPGGAVISARVVDSSGATLVQIGQQITVTATGLALDSPPSLPPAAPMAARRKKLPPSLFAHNVMQRLQLPASGLAGVNDDSDFSPLGMAINEKGLPVEKKIKKTNTPKRPAGGGTGDDESDPLFSDSSVIAAFMSRKGYQYYKARSDMSQAQTQNNPYFKNNAQSGEMVPMSRGPKHPDLMKREMGPGAITPAPSGLPGEVSFQVCALSLAVPAGPPLEMVHTYRSMVGNGTAMSHWENCYDISISPIPLTSGSNAAQVRIDDGGGRSDIFHRQADGTYRCDGMFREGRFDGDVFTLTFADKGTWVFNPLSHPTAGGKVLRIVDRNNLALVCDHDPSGRLASVSSQFGQSMTLSYGQTGALSQVSDQRGRFVSFAYYKAGDTGGNAGDLKGISCPRVNGSPPVAGPTTFTYTTGNSDPELNGNLLSITDGAGRELESFTYSATASPTDIDYDTCASHMRNKTGHVTLNRREIRPPGSSPGSVYTVFEVDEVGRLTEIDFDALHREVAVREYTGFCIPDVPVTSSSNRPTGKLHVSDPDYFETTCAYNADSCCTRITRPDGSQELTTYDRDFRKNCPVRERANPRMMTLRTSGGEMRTVTCDYLSDFGTPECRTQGTPIKGISVKGGRNPGGNIVEPTDKGWDGSVKGKKVGFPPIKTPDMDADNDGVELLKKEEGGRHTPFHNKYRPQFRSSAIGGITGGVIAAIVLAGPSASDFFDNDCDGLAERKGWDGSIKGIGCVTRMVSAYGQVTTCDYDIHGNLAATLSPVPGSGTTYQYNALGQVTTCTVLNGTSPSFSSTCVYNPASSFLSSVVEDSGGLNLTTSFERDDFNRVSRCVEPNGSDWLYGYNALDTCTQIQSPPGPGRISMNMTVDGAGRIARCDLDHRGADGSLDSSNPVYSTFFVRDSRANLVQVATEDRPVSSPPSALAPAASDLASYDVCDITLNNAGEIIRVSTPAACRGQATDLACDFTYNERGLLDRCIEGGLGTQGAVTTEYQYNSVRSVVRCTTVLSGLPSPASIYAYDGFHRPLSETDPMGNVVEYAYGNDGSIVTSVYGELNDQVGSGQNVLLSRYSSRKRVEVLKSNRSASGASQLADKSSMGELSSAFFTVETEDDTITVERFASGSTAPPTTEVTVMDRSPAGLIQQIRCNGDILANISYDSAGRSNACWNGACARTVTRDANGKIFLCGDTDHFSAPGSPGKTFTITRSFDAIGRCTQVTDGVGNTSHFAYDSLSRCVSQTQPGGLVIHTAFDGTSTAGAFSSQVSADFNGDGSLEIIGSSLVRCGELVSTANPNGYLTSYANDALGRLVRCDRPDGTFETSSYNGLGIRAQGTFSDGSVESRACDLKGRLTSVEWSNVPASVVAVDPKTFQYDGLGNLVSCIQGASTVTATYDSCGDQTSETQNGLTVSRTFNHRGRTGITYPDGKRFQETRNAFGELLSISGVTPTGTVISPPVVSHDYLGHQVCRTVQRNGVTTVLSYRADGETSPAGAEDFSFGSCVRETITDASLTVLSDTLISRDANQRVGRCEQGFVAQGQEKSRIKVTFRDVPGNVGSCVISRKESATSPPVVESSVSYVYTLEARKRISESRNGVTGGYTQDSALPPGDLQMGQYSTWPGGSLSWDGNGNIATFQKGSEQLTFVHDVEGRLVSVGDSVGEVVSYAYDAHCRRTARTGRNPQTGREIQVMIYDGPDCIQELDASNIADMTFVSADGIRQCISTRNGTIYYPHGGGASSELRWKAPELNSNSDRVSVITSAAGAVVERLDCDDAGKPIFLTTEGTPSGAIRSVIGLRWMTAESNWEPEIGMFAGPGGFHSPDLGAHVSSHKIKDAEKPKKNYVGHVTLMK